MEGNLQAFLRRSHVVRLHSQLGYDKSPFGRSGETFSAAVTLGSLTLSSAGPGG
jgi:hypothetical protein